jgi:DNA-binding MarR family transcriptional regulator
MTSASAPATRADADPDAPEFESMERSVWSLFRAARGFAGAAPGGFGDLQPAGWGVLRHVLVAAPVQPGAIAEAVGMDKSAVSRQLKALRDLGLVSMRRDDDDARVVLVEPTAEARHRARAVSETVRRGYARAVADWEPDEIERFAADLARFTAAVGR